MSGLTDSPVLQSTLNALNESLTQQIADITVGTLPGASDVNAGFTLLSGYLVRREIAPALLTVDMQFQ